MRLKRQFFQRDAREVARDLLGRVLVTNAGGVRTGGTIVETEAYLDVGDDASHARMGPTRRNRSMFLTGGHAYVYFIYGMYYCFNVVTGSHDSGQAVLIRALRPIDGIEEMRRRRGDRVRSPSALADGPGKLAIALGIGPELDGADLVTGGSVWIEEGVPMGNDDVQNTARIGITRSAEHPWRWVLRR